MRLTPVSITIRPVAVVAISVWPVAVAVVSIPGISLSLWVGSSFSSWLGISRPLSVVVAISVAVAVVAIPGISLSLRVGSRLGLFLRCTKCQCQEGCNKEESLHGPLAYSSAPGSLSLWVGSRLG